MSIVNARDYKLAFSLHKQPEILTPVPNVSIDKCRPLRNFAPITETQLRVSDRQWYGKGTSFPTFSDRIQRTYAFPATERSATSLETLWAAAFVMGKVVSSVPSSAVPLQYQHVVTFQDTKVNKECLYTTLVEEMGSEWRKALQGTWLGSMTLTGNRDDHVTLSVEGGGRKFTDSPLTMPVVTPASFYKTLYGKMSYGASPTPVDISCEVLSWTLTMGQNPQIMYLMCNSAGEEMSVSQALIGDQVCTGNAVIKVSALQRQRYLDDVEVAFTIFVKGPDLVAPGGQQHQVTITVPHCKIVTEAFGLDGTTVTYTLSWGEEGILKIGSEEPVTLTFISNIPTADILATP